MKNWFHRVILSRRWATFLVMGLSFMLFGATSVNLFFVASANIKLIMEHGLQALADGAAEQFLELLGTVYLSMAAYVVFKTCEHSLVHWCSESPADKTERTKAKS